MRSDFRLRLYGVSLAQVPLGHFILSLAKLHPAQAIQDVRVFGKNLMRSGNQLVGFAESHPPIGQGVAQSVVSMRVAMIKGNNRA